MDKILRKRRERTSLDEMVRHGILCNVIDDRKPLLLKKSPNLSGGGKWNGLGGKIGVGENSKKACIRGVYEESDLDMSNPKHHGTLRFWFGNTEEQCILCYVLSTNSLKGQLIESREGALQWFDSDNVPYEEMGEDDRQWLPLLMEGKSLNGELHFNSEGIMLLSHKLQNTPPPDVRRCK